MTQRFRTPSDDPDKRPLLDRIQDDRELAKAIFEWVVPVLDLIEDRDLYARCSLLLGYAAGRLTRGPAVGSQVTTTTVVLGKKDGLTAPGGGPIYFTDNVRA